MADVAVLRSPRRAHDLTLSVPASDGSGAGVSAAVSVSAVAISSRPSTDVHIMPIVHIANQTASSDTSSVGAGTVRGAPPAAAPQTTPQRRSMDTQTEAAPASAEPTREQRRRERRERRERAGRRPPPPAPAMAAPGAPGAPGAPAQLPDLLNSHVPPHGAPAVPPPYSTLPHGATRGAPPPPAPPPPPAAGRCPYVAPPGSPPRSALCFGDGYNLAGVSGRRLPYRTEEEDPKSCCGLVVTQSVSIRWFIVMIAFVGLCCAIVGTVLGALKATGREHLTVSLLMIGVGIVLITVSGIAWRLTSRDSPSCRMMLGLSRQQEEPESRRFMHRVVPAYGRPHHPYAAMVYPEFQFRPPPPSYHASMQAYRLGLLLDRHNATAAGHGATLSPPPSYRPGTGTLRPGMMNTLSGHSEYSHPPSYHSRQSSANPQQPAHEPPVCHSRNPSVLSFLSHESLVFGTPLDGIASTDGVNVISVLQTGSLEDGKRKRRREKRERESKEGKLEEEVKREDNLVTIVQTDGSHVTDQPPLPIDDTADHVTGDHCHVTRSNSVVVTVSGAMDRPAQPPTSDGEVEIVAHL